jgi:hypothetical protein
MQELTLSREGWNTADLSLAEETKKGGFSGATENRLPGDPLPRSAMVLGKSFGEFELTYCSILDSSWVTKGPSI